ncbi:germacrene-D synthase [Striga asiatica]|uniref:Germacrene-D synthase n=1 Tax=Striga asiatica TaxID=4170 RepID=A0A5A7R9U1_STRAF|nr:germacrene-D synthase [Striga asiatica]
MPMNPSATPASSKNVSLEDVRRSITFHPTVWGDHFLSYNSDTTEISEAEDKEQLEGQKERVKDLLVHTPDDSSCKLDLIDTIQRLGVGYHFEKEIDKSLQNIHGACILEYDHKDDDLRVVSLRFRLLRQQGYNVSCNVFNKFMDDKSNLIHSFEDDIEGILSLYEAVHLGVQGEDILDKALEFSSSHLESLLHKMPKPLATKVSEALKLPVSKSLNRLAAKQFISMYKEDDSHNPLLLSFAKLDFNILQKMHQKELSSITRWWKELDFANRLPFARDRLVECYFWTLAIYFEPQFNLARKFLVKVLCITSIIDDIYDIHGTLDDLQLFTDAIQRAYMEEAKWLYAKHTPRMEDYMKVALVSCGYTMLSITSFVGMGDLVKKEICDWVVSEPRIVQASSIICRLMDDVVGYGNELKITAVECYMKQNDALEAEAFASFREKVKKAWKDMNEECLQPTPPPSREISETEENEIERQKERVKVLLAHTPDDSLRKLNLIDTIQRLGVSYHFEKEIDTSLQNIHGACTLEYNHKDDDLRAVSLRFRLLRQHGYNVSCNVFNKFMDNEGNFKNSLQDDIEGILSLYEAAHFGVQEEDILDKALEFSSSTLIESVLINKNIPKPLATKVSEALKIPLHKNLNRMAAKKFISLYKEDNSQDPTLFNFAKLDFNILQKLHQKELSSITRWWKDLDFANRLPFARDRLVELYFWILAIHFEPQFHIARKFMVKVISIISVIDDIYDIHGTLDDLQLFDDAIQRWDFDASELLPPYMRTCYNALLDVYAEIETEIGINSGTTYCVLYSMDEVKRLVRAYMEEAKWLYAKDTPTMEDYMKVALVSCGYTMLSITSFVGMGDLVTKEICDWVVSEPRIVQASSIICRLMDDMVGYGKESKITAVECYMKQNDASEAEAFADFWEQVKKAWKDMNEECLQPATPPSRETSIGEEQEHRRKKELVKAVLDHTHDGSLPKLELIDSIQRLGVCYHFEKEIDTSLRNIHNTFLKCDGQDKDLRVVALHFRLLRQHGYYIPCDVFNKFIDHDGNLKELMNDVEGMLSLYEAAHFGVQGEEIMDKALRISCSSLKCLPHDTNKSLSAQVNEALNSPLGKSVTRLAARKYISMYQEDDLHNEVLLNFAKLDFNIVQKMHRKELRNIMRLDCTYYERWWKDLDFANKLPFARDRLVECYFWIVSVYFEPSLHIARKLLTKVIALASTIDDIYDVHGTLDELIVFTSAIQSWNAQAMDQLPTYMRTCYKALLDVYAEMEEETKKAGTSYRVQYAKEDMKKLVKSYMEEAKWFYNKYTPTMEEYMKVALISSGYMMLSTTSLVGLGDLVTREDIDWVSNEPVIVQASSTIARLMDDIAGYGFETKLSAVHCYMKQNGVTEIDAVNELEEQVEKAWKDINLECLGPKKVSWRVIKNVGNLARLINLVYADEDGYTNPKAKVKDYITCVLIEPVTIGDDLSLFNIIATFLFSLLRHTSAVLSTLSSDIDDSDGRHLRRPPLILPLLHRRRVSGTATNPLLSVLDPQHVTNSAKNLIVIGAYDIKREWGK